MDKKVVRIAMAELRRLREKEAGYRADVADWYENGDGRPSNYVYIPEQHRNVNMGGKGYTYPYCPHGSSRWTDYDNICGGCEDGYSVLQLALWHAKEQVAEYQKRTAWIASAPSSLDHDVRMDLVEWAIAPVM